MGRTGRVLLVGIEGAEPRVVREALKRGRLPNLAAIAQRGVSGRLRSPLPLASASVWTSVATGMDPAGHGVVRVARDVLDERRYFPRSTDRAAHAIWNIASDAGLAVGVVNWPATHPPEKVDGVMISDFAISVEAGAAPPVRPSVRPPVWPAEWAPRVETLLAERAPLTDVPDPTAGSGLPAWMDSPGVVRSGRDDAGVTRIARAVEADLRPDLMLVFLTGIDRVSHRWWGAFEDPSAYDDPPPLSESERATGREALLAYYAFTDALIGRLLEAYGPDDLVLILSGYGFEAGDLRTPGVHASPEAQYGVFFAAGREVVQPSRLVPPSGNDVTPTILTWLGIPPASDMDGRAAPFLTSPAIAKVATYDSPIERVAE